VIVGAVELILVLEEQAIVVLFLFISIIYVS
jgi:hypothetical protein